MNPTRLMKTLIVASCALLGVAVLAGAGDLVVYPLALVALAATGGLIHLTRTTPKN